MKICEEQNSVSRSSDQSRSKFLVAGCPSSHQPTRIREETLESGGPLQRKLNFRLCTVAINNHIINIIKRLCYPAICQTNAVAMNRGKLSHDQSG